MSFEPLAPTPMLPERPPSRGRVALKLAAGLSLLAFAAYALVPGLSDQGSADPESTPAEAARVVVADAGSASPQSASGLPAVVETFEVFGGKNPFEPPSVFPVSSPPDTVGEPASTPTDNGSGATTTTTPTDSGGGGGTTTTTQPVEQDPGRAESVALLEVFADSEGTVATVRVSGVVYQVREGDVFADSYQVVSLDQGTGCGEFLFGDSQFTLCEGQEILK